MGPPVTTNPLLIMFINMTVVFCVLWGLSLIIRLIKIIDPTQKKKLSEPAQPAPGAQEPQAAAAAGEDEDETAVIIAAAVAAMGYRVISVTAVRPVVSRAWRQAGRFEGIGNQLRMAER
jgi:sodium pump decarboxylase gamma subunit